MFVVSSQIAQPTPGFSHSCRTKVTSRAREATGLLRLAEQCGKDFCGGRVLYSGTTFAPLPNPKAVAVPLQLLWKM